MCMNECVFFFSYVLHKSQNASDIAFFVNYALSEENEEKNRPYAPDYIVCRTEQTTNVFGMCVCVCMNECSAMLRQENVE